MSIFYLQELCSVGSTLAVITPCAFTVICRTKCSIDDIPAGFVAIMLKLLTYVRMCVSPSFCWPIMIVPPVPRYAVPVVCPTPETPCGWNCNIGFPFAVVDTILRLPDSCIFSAFSHPRPVGVNNVEKGTFVLDPADACFCIIRLVRKME